MWPPVRVRSRHGRTERKGIVLERDCVVSLLKEFGSVEDVIVLRDRAFATFASASEAAAAAAGLHDKPHRAIRGLRFTVHPAGVVAGGVAVPTLPAAAAATGGPTATRLVPPSVATGGAAATSVGAAVPGLVLVRDFVTAEQEARLLGAVEAGGWEEGGIRRDVQHYGARFNYRTLKAEGPAVDARSVAGTDASDAPPAAADADSCVVPPLAGVLQATAEAVQRACDAHAAETITVPGAVPQSVVSAVFDQLTVNRYRPGEGISAHVDTHSAFGPLLCSLSLAAGTVMDFRCGGGKQSLYLPPRALLILSGPARYQWTHGIARRKTDTLDGTTHRRVVRTSLTYRTVAPLDAKCRCPFPDMCDSQGVALGARVLVSPHLVKPGPDGPAVGGATASAGSAVPTSGAGAGAGAGGADPSPTAASAPATAVAPHPPIPATTDDTFDPDPLVEREHVRKLYDTIAPHFSNTRYAGWPKVVQFLQSLPAHTVVADVGCGNGKYMGANPELVMVPLDNSVELVKISVDRGYPALAGDIMAVPLRTGSVDVAMCIAVLHHVSSPDRRIRAARELMRVVRSGGEVFVQAWAFEQDAGSRRKFETQDVMVPWCLSRRFMPSDPQVLADAHGVVDSTRNVVVFNRYCYVYREGELLRLFEAAAPAGVSLHVLAQYNDKSNWCLRVRVAKTSA